MAIKIRLQKIGKRNRVFFRIVVAEEATKRNGKTLATLGWYNPKTKPKTIQVDKKELAKWVAVGAQTSDAVKKILSKQNLE